MKSKISSLSKNEDFRNLLNGRKISNPYSTIFFKKLSSKNKKLLNVSFVTKRKIGKKKGAELAANLRALYTYNAGGFFGFAYANKGWKSWEDFRGKTIWNGPPRGAALNNARSTGILAAGLRDGKDYKGVQQNWGQLNTTLVDGSVDGFILPSTWPHPYPTTMTAAGKVNVFSMPKAKSFVVGVQWHAEFRVTEHPFNMALYSEFGEATKRRAIDRFKQPNAA